VTGDERQLEVFIEVPHEADRQDLQAPEGARIRWLPRDLLGLEHGAGMLEAARELASLPDWASREKSRQPLPAVDIERQILWESASPTDSDFYAWVAGESAAVMAIRKHWVNDLGLDRRTLSLMGYWKLGRSLE